MKTRLFNFRKIEFPGLVAIQKSRLSRYLAILLAFLTLNMIQGCYYFKVNTYRNPSSSKVSTLDNQGKNFILHFNDRTLQLTNVELRDQELLGEVSEIPRLLPRYVANPNKPNRYHKKSNNNQTYLLNEVHLYIDEYTDLGNNKISIPVSSISKAEVYDKDTATTTGSWILGGLGIAAGVYLILAILVLIFKQSCPFIYIHDGNDYRFAGEIFSGAIQPGLERNDYLRLTGIKPTEGHYHLKVTNEVKEIQHINLMQLMVIDHPENTEVLNDKYGTTHTIALANEPLEAVTLTGENVLPLVSGKDDRMYLFNGAATTGHNSDALFLTFDKPEPARKGKLLIRAKNSLWVENVFSGFHDKFGRIYKAFDRREEKRPAAELRELMASQGFPLSVYLKKNGSWELQDFYEIAGPMALKDDILAIDLGEIEEPQIQIKLETGFMFWEIDYAAIDYSENQKIDITTVGVAEALDENGLDVAPMISGDDRLYYSQPIIGNEANLIFDAPEPTNEARTVILHSKGYYKVLRDQTGKADWKELRTFREPGRMQKYSKELFEQYLGFWKQSEN